MLRKRVDCLRLIVQDEDSVYFAFEPCLGAENASLLSHFYAKTRLIYQDRLGTNIQRKVEKRETFVLFCFVSGGDFCSVLKKKRRLPVATVLRKTASFLSAFPMFVPSLAWQNDRLNVKQAFSAPPAPQNASAARQQPRGEARPGRAAPCPSRPGACAPAKHVSLLEFSLRLSQACLSK